MYVTDFDHPTYAGPPPSVVTRDAQADRLRLTRSPKPFVTAAALLLFDALALTLAVTLGAFAYALLRPSMSPDEALRLLPFVLIFPLGFAAARLYFPTGLGPVEELRRLVGVISGGFLALVLVLFLRGDLRGYSRGVFLVSWLAALVLAPLLRALCRELFARRSWWGAPVVVLGAAATAELVVRRLLRQPGGGLKPVACFDDDPTKQGRSVAGVPVIGDLAAAREVARALGIRHAVVAMPGVQSLELARLLRRYSDTFPYLLLIPNLFGLSSLSVSAREVAGVVGLYTRQNLLIPSNRLLKRLLDLALLLPALLVAAPLIALLALGVMAVSPGNPFYTQAREGYRGKRIRIWKLRTMHRDADAVLERHLAEHPAARAEWERFYKLRADPRILPIMGPLLRKTSLDELPQLWNIVLGQMSFVGPRPFPYYHLERFGADFRDTRRSVMPGLTGLWQVSARSDGDLRVQEELDGYYIRNWSMWMDLYLIARTPWAVLFGKGAY